jgi:hypothetical protein
MDGSAGILLLQLGNEFPECSTLFRRAGIGRFKSVSIKPAYVADANGVDVVPQAVGANDINRAAGADAAVQIDYVVVAYGAEAPGAVPAVQVLDGKVAAGGCGAAVDYYLCYLSHFLFTFRVIPSG